MSLIQPRVCRKMAVNGIRTRASNNQSYIDACLSGDVTRRFWIHDKSSSLDVLSTITAVKNYAEMSVKNNAGGLAFFADVPESARNCDG